MTWTRLTIHRIVSDCDLGKVSVYTPSEGCVGLRVVWITYGCYRTRYEHVSWVIRVEEHLPLVEFAYNNSYKRIYRWHRMRHCMGGHVGHHYVGPRWERAPSLVLI